MAQIADHRDLLTAYTPGSLPASERIVRVYQNEMLRSAFLLTGAPEPAVRLARDAFLDFFRRLSRGNSPEDPRRGILQSLANVYLQRTSSADEDADAPSDGLAGAIVADVDRQRYRVEDARSRTLASLDLLDRPTRIGLVLRDFVALEEEPVCQMLDVVPFTLREWLHPARERIIDAAGGRPDASSRELLVHTATAAPRPNLWPEVLGPLERLYAEEDERRQRYTYAAAGAVALLMLLAGLWLFDVFPFGRGDGDDAAAIPTAGPTATPTATPEPTATPLPPPSLSSFAIPIGDVPGDLYVFAAGVQDGEEIVQQGWFDLQTETFSPDLVSDGVSSLDVSPDGRFLVRAERIDAEDRAFVVQDSSSGELLWEIPLSERFHHLAITQDRIYLVQATAGVVDGEGPLPPELQEYDLVTGELVRSWPDLIPSMQTAVTDFFTVTLHATPDGRRLYIGLEEFGTGPSNISSRTLASFSLPDMTFESSSVQTDSTSTRQFPFNFSFFDALVTPDGAFIYNVNINEDLIHFRSSSLNEDFDLALPIAPATGEPDLLRWTVSNDGRYLYLVAPLRREAVIVDLLARISVRSFALEFESGVEPLEERFITQSSIGIGFGSGLSLSPDGRYVYMVGNTPDDVIGGFLNQSTIWTIDISTWTVIRSQKIEGLVRSVGHLDGNLIIDTDLPPAPNEPNNRLLAIDPLTGEIVSQFSGEGLPEWTVNYFATAMPELYRSAYGRAAAIDGAGPADVEVESTLPRIAVFATDDAIPAGRGFDIAVHVLNPSDQQLLSGEPDDVRFDPGSTVAVALRHEDGAATDIFLVANRTEPGLYRASTTLLETGAWSAEITITASDGQSWSVSAAELVQITPSWEASDGNRYTLRVETDPQEPPVEEDVAVTARFVDIESGAPLPEGVDLAVSPPDELSVAFRSNGLGSTTQRVTLGDDGIYTGTVSFWAAGEWEISVRVPQETGSDLRIDAGSVRVGG